MNIILAHNYYGSSAPSGENKVFEAEGELLRQRGHTVYELTRHSDKIRSQGVWGTIHGGFSTPWNFFSKRTVENLIEQVAPDVFHVHNSFPLLSPSVFYGAKNTKTPTVLTLHNFRIYCAAGMLLRGDRPCKECLDKRIVSPALRHKCYRGSLAATIPMAAMIWLHRMLRTWELQVDSFIALTEFQKEIFSAAGLPRERIFVKPHFYPNSPDPLPWRDREAKVVFIGRLGFEKGCHILLEAWRRWGLDAPHLEVIGDGPERLKLESFVRETSLNKKVTFRGQLSFEEVKGSLRKAWLLVVPSICYETFGKVILEAYAFGVPVIASKLGSLPCLVNEGITGALFDPGNPNDLLDKVENAWVTPNRLSAWGAAARRDFDLKFTAAVNYKLLMQIYEFTVEYKKKKLSALYPL